MHNRNAERKKWLTRNWKLSPKGNHWLKADGFHVVVYPTNKPGIWGAFVTNLETGAKKQIPTVLTQDGAKLAAFDVITTLLATN